MFSASIIYRHTIQSPYKIFILVGDSVVKLCQLFSNKVVPDINNWHAIISFDSLKRSPIEIYCPATQHAQSFFVAGKHISVIDSSFICRRRKGHRKIFVDYYPATLENSGVLSSPERASGRQGRQGPLILSRPYFFTDNFQTWQGHFLP